MTKHPYADNMCGKCNNPGAKYVPSMKRVLCFICYQEAIKHKLARKYG